jgi:hypothetical protein
MLDECSFRETFPKLDRRDRFAIARDPICEFAIRNNTRIALLWWVRVGVICESSYRSVRTIRYGRWSEWKVDSYLGEFYERFKGSLISGLLSQLARSHDRHDCPAF